MLKRLTHTRLFILKQQPARPKTAAPPVVLDTFTAANGTLLTAHTPDVSPAAWVMIGASPAINGNKCTGALGSATINAGIANAKIGAYVAGTSGYVSIYARYNNTANHWNLKISFSNNTLELIEVSANVSTPRAALNRTVNDGQPHLVTLTLNGNELSFKVDDSAVQTCSSAAHSTQTKHGLSIAAASASIDTFKVERA